MSSRRLGALVAFTVAGALSPDPAGAPAAAAEAPGAPATPTVVADAPTPEDVTRAVRDIQNACFSLYPPDLLAQITGVPDGFTAEAGLDPVRILRRDPR